MKTIHELELEYFKAGGKLIHIRDIDMYRDGGTIGIRTLDREYYICHVNKTVHVGIPCKDSNLVIDKGLLAHLSIRTNSYMDRLKHNIDLCGKSVSRINDLINK
jgi:hypothetical protein